MLVWDRPESRVGERATEVGENDVIPIYLLTYLHQYSICAHSGSDAHNLHVAYLPLMFAWIDLTGCFTWALVTLLAAACTIARNATVHLPTSALGCRPLSGSAEPLKSRKIRYVPHPM